MMQPTTKLRFVNRAIDYKAGQTEHGDRAELPRLVLQQWWVENTVNLGFGTIETGRGEWRDIPTENE